MPDLRAEIEVLRELWKKRNDHLSSSAYGKHEVRFRKHAIGIVLRLAVALEEHERGIEKLARFKAWVHEYLDNKGVPHHPPGVHGAECCRIGDRMDHVFARLEAAEREAERLRAALRPLASRYQEHQAGVPFFQINTVSLSETEAAAAALEGRDDGK